MSIMKKPVSLQSRDIQLLSGKLSKFVCNWRGKVFRAAAKGILYAERFLLWSRHFATQSPLAAAARNTFPRQLQTFRVFPTIVVHRVILGPLVTSLWICESVTFFLNCHVLWTRVLLKNLIFAQGVEEPLCLTAPTSLLPRDLRRLCLSRLWSSGLWRSAVL
jgi:hypothetical protein